MTRLSRGVAASRKNVKSSLHALAPHWMNDKREDYRLVKVFEAILKQERLNESRRKNTPE